MYLRVLSTLLLAACTAGAPKQPDGAPDDTDDAACAPLPWYADADADGYGVDAGAIEACEAPVGTVATAGDCDDARADVSPAGVELCTDSADEDCDGTAPPCALVGDLDLGGANARLPLAFDGEGYPLGPVGDVDGDGRDDFVAVATGADEAAHVFAGIAGAVDTTAAFAVVTSTETNHFYAPSVAPTGDVTGTGAPTLAIGTEHLLSLWETPLAGGVLGPPDVVILDDYPDYEQLSGPHDFVSPGDVDGDGYRDLAIATRDDSDYLDLDEELLIFRGPFDADRGLSDADTRITEVLGGGRSEVDQIAALGDHDGDGLGDLALLWKNVGVYVHGGDATGDVHRRDDATAYVAGPVEAHRLARGAADVDGDGYADLAVGGGSGAVYVVRGPLAGDTTLDDAWTVILLEASSGVVALEGVGDTDGDGAGDLLVGAGWDWSAPAAWLYTGLGAGAYGSLDATATIRGEGGTETGHWLAGAGDHDGDGLQDVLVGASEPDYHTLQVLGLYFGG